MEVVIRKKQEENFFKKEGKAEIIDFKKRQEKKEEDLFQKIEKEKLKSKERFKDLIEKVSFRYCNLPEDMHKDFIKHNDEILDNAIELGIRRGFSREELEKLELSAILHDMTKADSTPEKYKEVPNYTLAMHAKTASEEVLKVLDDNYLKEIGFQGDLEMIRQEVAEAVLEHMGPRPGFMSEILEKFNEKMESIGEEKINYPKAGGKISRSLLAADMRSLAGEEGRKKIISIRANTEFFKKQDRELSEEYKKHGIDLSQGEAALIAAFKSAFEARDMQEDRENWNWINEVIEKSKKVAFSFPGLIKTMSWKDIYSKISKYEEKIKIEEFKKRLEAA